jgi:UDP-N-acetylmuramoyl-L-alanyl-D-glutamate--2,6-diaminopimelate ligase
METPLWGRFNAINLLQAMAAVSREVSMDEMVHRVATFYGVTGRMQRFPVPGGGEIIVDFAHSPAAFEETLLALRERNRGVIHTLFGCGGDRDRGKRPLMAAVSEQHSDFSILTDDNPRGENPKCIAEEIMRGFSGKNFCLIHDRREAIYWAIKQLLQHRGTLLLAGKGHENFQQVGNKLIPHSDIEIVTHILGKCGMCLTRNEI